MPEGSRHYRPLPSLGPSKAEPPHVHILPLSAFVSTRQWTLLYRDPPSVAVSPGNVEWGSEQSPGACGAWAPGLGGSFQLEAGFAVTSPWKRGRGSWGEIGAGDSTLRLSCCPWLVLQHSGLTASSLCLCVCTRLHTYTYTHVITPVLS